MASGRIAPVAGAEPDILVKLVLIGESGVGKTNLLSQFCKKQFNPDSKPTIGVEFLVRPIQVQGKNIRTQVWDTAGQERYRAIADTYYRGAVGALVVYDISASFSFHAVTRWVNEIRQHTRPELPILLVGNKSDLEANRSVSQEEGKNIAEKERLLFFETSALDGSNVEEAFLALVSQILDKGLVSGNGGAGDLEAPRPGVAVVTEQKSGCC
jgi:small GTP-binding protein